MEDYYFHSPIFKTCTGRSDRQGRTGAKQHETPDMPGPES